MKKLLISLGLVFGLLACTEEVGNRGRLKISITDAPSDDINLKSVNLIVDKLEGKKNGEWVLLQNYETSFGFNLIAFTGGNSVTLFDRFIDPGDFTAFRVVLAVQGIGSIIRNPSCNVAFQDNTIVPLAIVTDTGESLEFESSVNVVKRSQADITIDLDARKSIRKTSSGQYQLVPFYRTVRTAETGLLAISLSPSAERLLVMAYKQGTYTAAEAQPVNGVRFLNSVTSSAVKQNKAALGFLEAGNYELVIVQIDNQGEFIRVVGRTSPVSATAGENKAIEIDLGSLQNG